MVVVCQRQAAASVVKRATASDNYRVFARLHHNCANAFSDSTLVGPKQQAGAWSGVLHTMSGNIQTLENYMRP